ncbi:MAG: methyltransferase domain-containing protein [Methylococcaceae bacterium]
MNLTKQAKDAFNKLISFFPFNDYIDVSVYYEILAILRELNKFVSDFEGKKLLDIGSGPMDKTAIFQFMGFQCYAVDDLSDPWHNRDSNINLIKSFAKSTGINFFHQKDGDYTIPFDAQSFDVVCSLAVIEHLHESPRSLLNTMGNYLKVNGLLVVVMPNSVNLRKRLSVLIGRTNYVPVEQFFYSDGLWRGHVREYTLAEAEFICRQSGFEVVASRTFESLAQVKLKTPFRQLYLLMGSVLPTTRSSLLVVCRKPPTWMPVESDFAAFRKACAGSVPKGVA